MMAREHGSRIMNWWRRLRTCDRLALVMALVLAGALVRDMPRTSDDGSTAAWDAPPQPYDAAQAKKQLWGGSNATLLPTVAACARVRNEGPYLKEWIEFHLLTGMSHFYIFDDASSDNTRDVLEPYVQRGIVRLWSVQEKCPKHREEICVSREHDAEHGERGFRDECLRFNPDGADWVAAIDVDEFLYPSAGLISASRRVEAPSRHLHESSPGMMEEWVVSFSILRPRCSAQARLYRNTSRKTARRI
jgi:hypothetical protein